MNPKREGSSVEQVHKRFTDDQVKELIERYLHKEIERTYVQEILGIHKRRFFQLIAAYRDNPEAFSMQYCRTVKTRSIDERIEAAILKELAIDKQLIEDREVPLRRYNYSYVKDRLKKEYRQRVSLPTIIDRAKKNGFYLQRPKRASHEHEVATRYAGELIQHDASYHLWAPLARQKWYLITSLDDYSRFMLYAALLKEQTAWTHIAALESVFLRWGFPYTYYVDSHSIFRFVQGRDSFWRKHELFTDEADPQWKQVLKDCNVKVVYALSPQAKGKIERPYGWLQDRLIRTCVRENVTDLGKAQTILKKELYRYNYRQVHSTTGEIPYTRFSRALRDKRSLFREFTIGPPYQSVKDIFSIRIQRTVNPYGKISLYNLQLRVKNAKPKQAIIVRMYPQEDGLTELRMWSEQTLLDVHRVKTDDLKAVHF